MKNILAIRQFEIPNLICHDITEDIIFSEEIKLEITYDFDTAAAILILFDELGIRELTGTLKHVSHFSTLEMIKNTLEGKIIDAIENNTFKLIGNKVSAYMDGLNNYTITVHCDLQLLKKY